MQAALGRPLATRILADLGADVIKVEAPTGRGAATPAAGVGRALGGSGDHPWNQQGSFNKLGRNKRSLAVDLKSTEGRELFLRLVAESDVVIENFSARAMERLGLGYERVRAANESIIYVGMPGFGRSGPYRDYVALGPSIEPMTGLPSLWGTGTGRRGSPRRPSPTPSAGPTVPPPWSARCSGVPAPVAAPPRQRLPLRGWPALPPSDRGAAPHTPFGAIAGSYALRSASVTSCSIATRRGGGSSG